MKYSAFSLAVVLLQAILFCGPSLAANPTRLVAVPESPSVGSRFFVCTESEMSVDENAQSKWTVFHNNEEVDEDGVRTRGTWLQIVDATEGSYICVLETKRIGGTVERAAITVSVKASTSGPPRTLGPVVATRSLAAAKTQPAPQADSDPAPLASEQAPDALKQKTLDRIKKLDVWTRDVHYPANTKKLSEALRRAAGKPAASQDEFADNLFGELDPVFDEMKGRYAVEAWTGFLEDITNEAAPTGYNLSDGSVADAAVFWRAVADGIDASIQKRDTVLRKQAVAYLVSKGFRASDFSNSGSSSQKKHGHLRLFRHHRRN